MLVKFTTKIFSENGITAIETAEKMAFVMSSHEAPQHLGVSAMTWAWRNGWCGGWNVGALHEWRKNGWNMGRENMLIY